MNKQNISNAITKIIKLRQKQEQEKIINIRTILSTLSIEELNYLQNIMNNQHKMTISNLTD